MVEKFKLGLHERFALIETLPKKGDFKTLKEAAKLKKELWLSEQESAEFEVVPAGPGKIDWNHDKEKDKEFNIPEFMVDIITDTLVKLDKLKQLEEKHYGLYKKFVEVPE